MSNILSENIILSMVSFICKELGKELTFIYFNWQKEELGLILNGLYM